MTQAAPRIEPDPASHHVHAGQERARRLRCIVMDGSSLHRMVLRRIAQESCHDVELIETSSIATTRAVLDDGVADVLILGDRAPDGQGLGFARQLRQEASHSRIPVIVLGGDSSRAALLQAIRCGVVDYLPKDELSVELFDQALANALGRPDRRAEERAELVSRLASENAALRRLVLRNMRLLKGQSMPLLSFAWRMIGSGSMEEEGRGRSARHLAQITRNVTALIDDTVIVAAESRTGEPRSSVDLGDIVAAILADETSELAESRAHIAVGALPGLMVRRSHMVLLFEELLLTAMRAARLGQVPEIEIASGVDPDGNPVIRMVENGLRLSARKQSLGERFCDLSDPPEQTGHDEHAWSLCQRLVEKNGGEMRITGGADEGTTVSIRFPKAMLT